MIYLFQIGYFYNGRKRIHWADAIDADTFDLFHDGHCLHAKHLGL